MFKKNLQLVVDPEVLIFKAGNESELNNYLLEYDKATITYDLTDAKMLLLDPDTSRTLIGSYLMSAYTFGRVCDLIAPGLRRVVFDMAGYVTPQRAEKKDITYFSIPDAIFIYNTFIKRRFKDSFDSWQLLRDTRTGAIDGISGGDYQRISNSDFYITVRDSIDDCQRRMVLDEARVVGREFCAHFVDEEPFYKSDIDEFRHGVYCVNTETGHQSVRLANTISRSFDGSKICAPLSNRFILRHRGSSFRARLSGMITKVVDRNISGDWFVSKLKLFSNKSLGFTGRDDDADELNFQKIVSAMASVSFRYSSDSAKHHIRRALMLGAYDKTASIDLSNTKRNKWKTRTLLDLFWSISRDAKKRSIYLREKQEQYCHKMLGSKIFSDKFEDINN